MVRHAARIYWRIIAAFAFDAGPNKRIFTAITFVAAAFMPHLSCARSSGPSFRIILILKYTDFEEILKKLLKNFEEILEETFQCFLQIIT